MQYSKAPHAKLTFIIFLFCLFLFQFQLHLVFWDKNTFETFATAAKSDRGIAVVAVLFQV